MPPKYLQELIKSLQEFYKCPSCDMAYNFADIQFLGEVERYYLVQLSCHDCSLPVVTALPVDGGRIAPRRTDLGKAEQTKFATRGAISAGEIAEFHRQISRRGFTF